MTPISENYCLAIQRKLETNSDTPEMYSLDMGTILTTACGPGISTKGEADSVFPRMRRS